MQINKTSGTSFVVNLGSDEYLALKMVRYFSKEYQKLKFHWFSWLVSECKTILNAKEVNKI